MNQIAILTGHTCGPACWEAREDVCRCSCGGKNHGCLRHANGLSPARSRKIDGDFYTLQAVGQYGTLDGDAMELNKAAGVYCWPIAHGTASHDKEVAKVRTAGRGQVESWPGVGGW